MATYPAVMYIKGKYIIILVMAREEIDIILNF